MAPSARFVGSTLLAVAMAGCATAGRVNTADEEATIRNLSAAMARAAAGKDAAGVMSAFAPDATFMPPNESAATGTAAIREKWTNLFGLPELQLSWSPVDVRVADSGELATERGTWQLSFRSPDGPVRDEGSYVTTWRKSEGQWKIASDIVTSSTPLPPPVVNVVLVEAEQMQMHPAAGLQWSDLNVPGFAPGLKLAVIHGDPMGTSDYTIRLRFPDRYEFPPHFHPNAEHLTVLSGTFMLAMGTRADRTALKTYAPGDFLYIPPKQPHFGGVRGETVIQLHGIGPFEINLVTPVS